MPGADPALAIRTDALAKRYGSLRVLPALIMLGAGAVCAAASRVAFARRDLMGA